MERHLSKRKLGKTLGPSGRHIPNKAERKLLTQMIQKSGASEEEIRSNKSNRIKLAEARASMSKGKGSNEYVVKRFKRRVANVLELQPYDERVEKISELHFKNNPDYSNRYGWFTIDELEKLIKQLNINVKIKTMRP